MTFSDKVLLYIARNRKEMSKSKLADELQISRPTLDKRLQNNSFEDTDIRKLRQLGILSA